MIWVTLWTCWNNVGVVRTCQNIRLGDVEIANTHNKKDSRILLSDHLLSGLAGIQYIYIILDNRKLSAYSLETKVNTLLPQFT